ncbi:hypothetical protein OSB04_012676 [Centaurea solstitialis]|uniref:Integrase catalytic domain-containing protein n=1 Tax=Centaurea solstitialis TaxID=347529 RepID=A0AA38WET6_9ASTR|nr:hypothetical protein OSB04_012676 [Centaurea solstitialis]
MNNLPIPLPEIFQVGAIVNKLPPSWKNFSKRMMHKSKYYSLDDLLKHLRIEEEIRNRYKKGKPHANVHSVQASGKGKGKFKFVGPTKKCNMGPQKKSFKRHRQSSGQGNLKRNGKCHVCEETEHYARECKQRKSGTPGIANAVAEIEDLMANLSMEEIDMLAMNGSIALAAIGGWFFDTGAIVHFSSKFVHFSDLFVFPELGNHKSRVGKSRFPNQDLRVRKRAFPSTLDEVYCRTVRICSGVARGREKGKDKVTVANMNIADVAGIRTVQLHFTSGNILTLLNVVLTIAKSGDGVIAFIKDKRYIGRAYRDRGMYTLSLKDHADDDSDSDESMNDRSDDEDVNDVSDGESIGSNATMVEGFVSGDGERSDSVSSDDMVVFPVDAFVFENDFYTFIFDTQKMKLLKFSNIIKLKSKIRKEKRIKILRSDRGGEYFSSKFDTFCEEDGIKHERTSPSIPQQNGLAERKNRTLVEMGCVAYYRTPDPKRSKLGARAIKSIFVGYANNSIAYRLLDNDSGVIVEFRDVEFFEDKFSEDAENSDKTSDTGLPGTSREDSKTSQRVDEPRRSTE